MRADAELGDSTGARFAVVVASTVVERFMVAVASTAAVEDSTVAVADTVVDTGKFDLRLELRTFESQETAGS